MVRFHVLLHPTDFSSSSAEAFKFASALARDCKAKLVVIHAIEPEVAMVGEGALVPFDLKESRVLADRNMQGIESIDPTIHLEKVVREGPAPTVILEAADEFGADLIVMGTHGRTGIKRLLLGSVAELVLRRANCPVLTVKEESHAGQEAASELETAGSRS